MGKKLARPASDDTTFFAENLTYEIKKHGGIGAVSTATGISRQMLKRYMDGAAEPGLTSLIKLSTVLQVTVEDLCGIVSDTFTSDQFSAVPYFDIDALPSTQQKKHQSFSDDILGNFLLSPSRYADEFLVQFDDLRLFYVDDNNMSPTINKGDIAVISVALEHKTPCDGIFLLCFNEAIMMRRLQYVSPKKLLAMSDNPHLESFRLEQDNETSILARVLMVIAKT